MYPQVSPDFHTVFYEKTLEHGSVVVCVVVFTCVPYLFCVLPLLTLFLFV